MNPYFLLAGASLGAIFITLFLVGWQGIASVFFYAGAAFMVFVFYSMWKRGRI